MNADICSISVYISLLTWPALSEIPITYIWLFAIPDNINYFLKFPVFPQLEGVNEPVVLQVFVANDAGRVKPHGFYQACRVTGRNTTACKEVDIEGTTVIEIPLEPSSDMTLA